MTPARPTPDPRHSDGRRGEELVAARLVERGFAIEARNFRIAGVEVDLVARRATSWVLVEVKTSRGALPPEILLRESQRARLHRAANALRRRRTRKRTHVDVLLGSVWLDDAEGFEIRFFRIDGLDAPTSP